MTGLVYLSTVSPDRSLVKMLLRLRMSRAVCSGDGSSRWLLLGGSLTCRYQGRRRLLRIGTRSCGNGSYLAFVPWPSSSCCFSTIRERRSTSKQRTCAPGLFLLKRVLTVQLKSGISVRVYSSTSQTAAFATFSGSAANTSASLSTTACMTANDIGPHGRVVSVTPKVEVKTKKPINQ